MLLVTGRLCRPWSLAATRALKGPRAMRLPAIDPSAALRSRHPASRARPASTLSPCHYRSYSCVGPQSSCGGLGSPVALDRRRTEPVEGLGMRRSMAKRARGNSADPAGSAQVFLRPEAPATVPLAALELSAAPGKPRVLHLQKADAAASLGLMVRDMRAVDATFRTSTPTIVSRNAGIIIHLEHIRVIITTDRVLVFDPGNPDVEAFVPRLQSRLLSVSHPMPFELRAVEGVLVDVCASLNAQLGTLTPSIDLVLDTLSTTTDFGGSTVQHCLDRLLPLEVSGFGRLMLSPI